MKNDLISRRCASHAGVWTWTEKPYGVHLAVQAQAQLLHEPLDQCSLVSGQRSLSERGHRSNLGVELHPINPVRNTAYVVSSGSRRKASPHSGRIARK
jgi:hypothetical protein